MSEKKVVGLMVCLLREVQCETCTDLIYDGKLRASNSPLDKWPDSYPRIAAMSFKPFEARLWVLVAHQ